MVLVEYILMILMLGDVVIRVLILGRLAFAKTSSKIEISLLLLIGLTGLYMLKSNQPDSPSEEIDLFLLIIRVCIQMFRIVMYSIR